MSETVDIEAVFNAHIAAEFVQHDLDATMATMTDEPYVYQVPAMTGGVGFEGVRSFYDAHFIGKFPADSQITPVSRKIGENHVVDEFVLSFTQDIEMDAIVPGVPPTGKAVRLPFCVVSTFEGGKMHHEHIYWDQASLLVQLGLLDPSGLPVTGAEQADNVLDPSAHPLNGLISRGQDCPFPVSPDLRPGGAGD